MNVGDVGISSYKNHEKEKQIERNLKEAQTENTRLKTLLTVTKRVYLDEIAHLHAELEALKPTPTVRNEYFQIFRNPSMNRLESSHGSRFYGKFDNLKLTFHDGKLVTAEVLDENR